MRPLVLVFALALSAAAPGTALAAHSYDGCKYTITTLPAVLTTQGTWCLKGDLATDITSGSAITINANNVTLDCNDFKLGGLGAGMGTQTFGIRVSNRVSATVRNCNVRGFFTGIRASNAPGTTIEDNRIEYSTSSGIEAIDAPGALIRRNRISETGGTTLSTFYSFGIYVEFPFAEYGQANVIDNIIEGVRGQAGGTSEEAHGIYTYFAEGTVTGNRISGVVATGAGTISGGIYNQASGHIVVDHNYVRLSGEAATVGVYCTNNNGYAADNRLLGAFDGIQGCTTSNNYIDTD